MEKNCLVTKLKSRTGNTNLPVMGFIKIKISSIIELNDDPWNIFGIYAIEGKTVTVKIIGEGYIYSSEENRASNTNGVKSVLITTNMPCYFSNGDYEILIEKYTVDKITSKGYQLRSDNIHFDYKTFENSSLTSLNIKFATVSGVLKYKTDISGSMKNLPRTITDLVVYGNAEHPVQLGDISHISKNLINFEARANGYSFGSFDDVEFNKVMKAFGIGFCNFTGNIKNVPVVINSDQNLGLNDFNGDVKEFIERLAKNSDMAKNVFIYAKVDSKLYWRDTLIANLPTPGYLYLTLNGTGGVTVYSNKERTNLLGSFDGTTWSYPS